MSTENLYVYIFIYIFKEINSVQLSLINLILQNYINLIDTLLPIKIIFG